MQKNVKMYKEAGNNANENLKQSKRLYAYMVELDKLKKEKSKLTGGDK